MTYVIAALAGPLVFTGGARAADDNSIGPSASSRQPGRAMQDKGSIKGSPDASSQTPSHETKGDAAGSARSGSGSTGTSSGLKVWFPTALHPSLPRGADDGAVAPCREPPVMGRL